MNNFNLNPISNNSNYPNKNIKNIDPNTNPTTETTNDEITTNTLDITTDNNCNNNCNTDAKIGSLEFHLPVEKGRIVFLGKKFNDIRSAVEYSVKQCYKYSDNIKFQIIKATNDKIHVSTTFEYVEPTPVTTTLSIHTGKSVLNKLGSIYCIYLPDYQNFDKSQFYSLEEAVEYMITKKYLKHTNLIITSFGNWFKKENTIKVDVQLIDIPDKPGLNITTDKNCKINCNTQTGSLEFNLLVRNGKIVVNNRKPDLPVIEDKTVPEEIEFYDIRSAVKYLVKQSYKYSYNIKIKNIYPISNRIHVNTTFNYEEPRLVTTTLFIPVKVSTHTTLYRVDNNNSFESLESAVKYLIKSQYGEHEKLKITSTKRNYLNDLDFKDDITDILEVKVQFIDIPDIDPNTD
jgi:hypothetical protein